MSIKLKNLLKPEVVEILNDIKNYISRKDYDPTEILRCKLCEIKIEKPSLPFIIWSKNQEYFCPFHLQCAIKPECVDIFIINEIGGNIGYTYNIDNSNKGERN
ncbi:MAG: hypothetical protein EU529_11475 [Promethearchaeota archaeon]|nr:MAG: hypothetical protein EU529_11475 [Candidatus Lokiarchaeota archaeon]